MTKKPPQHFPTKAYKDEAFINSPEARPVRILAEYIEPQTRFAENGIQDTILFYGSARIISREEAQEALEAAKAEGGDIAAAERRLEISKYYEATRELSNRLTQWSKDLRDESGRRFVICTGGGPGIMEAANRGASEAQGENVGLGISLPFEVGNNPWVTRSLSLEFHYFFTRKFWFLYLAKALVLMPGGFGTMDELFEALTLLQTRKMRKKLPIVLFGREFWDKVLNFEAMVDFGTISPEDVELMIKTDSVDEAFKYITDQLCEHALHCPGGRL
ncbi:MAG: LOG family protein [Alphaproteobacteria bacterium]|uniref:LOG family protein n=1 Tax=Maricaulis alexandrii TaxID=2570354 RepID=UPI0011080712|nr:LOG family protein [Maricaulis alexandrii]MCR9266371.1 LOG family protein [Alphaproteobacteria bacterium]